MTDRFFPDLETRFFAGSGPCLSMLAGTLKVPPALLIPPPDPVQPVKVAYVPANLKRRSRAKPTRPNASRVGKVQPPICDAGAHNLVRNGKGRQRKCNLCGRSESVL